MMPIVVIGKESVGKSTFINGITGKQALSEPLKGTTVSIETYSYKSFNFIDTPGIVLDSDSITTKLALKQIPNKKCITLVVSAMSLDSDLSYLLPLVQDKKGILVINYWNKIKDQIPSEKILNIKKELGVDVFTVDARNPTNKEQIIDSCLNARKFRDVKTKVNVKLTPGKDIFDIPIIGQILSWILLFTPALIAVQFAIVMADNLYDKVFNNFSPLIAILKTLPPPINYILAMDYGLFSMMPFLILYALPTVFLFSFLIALYKSSGLIDRLTISIHNSVKHLGLTGRDIVRIIMGFGCNVPAVISTRSCSACTRGNCVSAISFGAACSYQLPATVAVFAAANMGYLILPYLVILGLTTVIYLYINARWTRTRKSKKILLERSFLQLPNIRYIINQQRVMLQEFLSVALPIFVVICVIAGIIDWTGILDIIAWIVAPIMIIYNLPAEAGTAVVLGSIRKDGIAIGLLSASWDGVKIPISHPSQVLTIVYMAGVLFPCLVTLYTIYKELGITFAMRMLGKQVIAALLFSFCIAWMGYFLF